jgi:hypothetical protein
MDAVIAEKDKQEGDARQLSIHHVFAEHPLFARGIETSWNDQHRRVRWTASALNGMQGKHQILATARYTYDVASRLKTVGDGEREVSYSYLENSPLLEHVEYRNGEDLRMTTRKQYDQLDRLTSIESQPSNDFPVRYACEY